MDRSVKLSVRIARKNNYLHSESASQDVWKRDDKTESEKEKKKSFQKK